MSDANTLSFKVESTQLKEHCNKHLLKPLLRKSAFAILSASLILYFAFARDGLWLALASGLIFGIIVSSLNVYYNWFKLIAYTETMAVVTLLDNGVQYEQTYPKSNGYSNTLVFPYSNFAAHHEYNQSHALQFKPAQGQSGSGFLTIPKSVLSTSEGQAFFELMMSRVDGKGAIITSAES